MNRAARALSVALAVIALVSPSISAPIARMDEARRPVTNLDRRAAADPGLTDRQDRLWRRLSGSICTGCITAANRVAPVSYERPSLVALAQPKAARVATAKYRPRGTVRYAHLRKRYARLHARGRNRIAARRHPVRIARAVLRKRYALHRSVPLTLPIGWSNFDDRSRTMPTGQPEAPRDNDRQHGSILPLAETRPRRS